MGEANLYAMLAEHRNIQLVKNAVILETNAVVKAGTRVVSLATQTNGTGAATVWTGSYFIDGSYEGDLVFQAGASMTFGRESKDVYNESYGGITESSQAQFHVDVDAAWSNGTLLDFISHSADPRLHLGEADDNMMAYSFRACLTTRAGNMVPFPKPVSSLAHEPCPAPANPSSSSHSQAIRRLTLSWLVGTCLQSWRPSKTCVCGHAPSRRMLACILILVCLHAGLPWGFLAYSAYPPGDKRDAW